VQRQASFNDLFNASFEEVAANRAACLIYLAVTVPLGVVSLAVFDAVVTGPEALLSGTARDAGTVMGMIASTLLGMVLQFWFSTALLRRSLRPDLGQLLPYLGISVLSFAGMVIGLALLLVPGLILISRWILVIPLVLDGRVPAMDSFVESWERTQASAWAIFGLAILYLVFVVFLSIASSTIAGQLPDSLRIAGWLVESLTSQGGTILSSAVMIGTYRLLGDNTREIAEVFA
jgi:hypothetical protein